MTGHNELLFTIHTLAAGAFVLAAARLGRVWLVAMIVICTILMNLAVFKQMTLFGLPVTGGNVLFAAVFLSNDILNEHFGPRAARQAVWIGFAGGLVVIAMMAFVGAYLPNEYDDAQSHLRYFFNPAAYARIVVASMASYLMSQMLDVALYRRIRARTGDDRLLWLRSNASTWASQAFDTAIFTTAGLTGFGGIIQTWPEWWGAVVFAYVIKIGLAAADTSVLYLTTWTPLCPRDSIYEGRVGAVRRASATAGARNDA
jgi:hypothetical protein